MAKNPRQRAPVQVNQFVGGLNTEANPLSFPPTASIDEQNMSVNRDGSRSRRLGFDVETEYELNSTGISLDSQLELGRSQFRWENAGGSGSAEFMVVQIGNTLAFHDLNSLPLSDTPAYTKTFDTSRYDKTFSYAVVDGILVVVTGEKNFYSFSYDNGTFSEETGKLLIRDLFGVSATVGGVVLTDPQNFSVRPTSLNSEHLYNLRNQTYGLARKDHNSSDIIDPLDEFNTYDGSAYPSNADNLTEFLFADANYAEDRTVERYQHKSNVDTLPSTVRAPLGFFIIDATDRGTSRLEREEALRERNPQLTHSVLSLPEDRTPGGASVISQYAGRVWYAGFSGDLVDGDSQSPRMSSYVLFSKTVQSPSDIGRCYQEADPTSNIDSALVDTDGGFIKIDGAYNIKALVPADSSLFVLAENGVWRIVGVDENVFNPTSYSVSKISEEGCIASKSVVVNNKSLVYWGHAGIFGVAQNSTTGGWGATNLTQETIQTFYDDIPASKKAQAEGYYDPEGVAFRWIWAEDEDDRTHNELILHLKFTVFTREVVNLPTGVWNVSSVAGGQTTYDNQLLTVTSQGATVTSQGEDVTVPTETLRRGATTAYYTVITSTNPLTYTFGRYNNQASSYDWEVFGTPTDTPAYLLTGSITGGDARLRKDVPYLTVYFKQPEDMGDASCVFNARWDWTVDYLSGKWSSPRQIFRRQRFSYDGGLLATRNRVRGNGRSVAFRFESEEGMPMHIYGWEFNLEATREE